MKNAPVHTTNESAPDKRDYTPGTLPKRINTVTADVLACLLESQTMTGMKSVFKEHTTRLSAVIHYLESPRYGWTIDRRTVSTGTNDGRVAEISAYWLSQATIAQAFEAGAREWIDRVKTARTERRKQTDACKRVAHHKNAVRKIDPRQGGLWGEL
jgi:hypothetical protein